MLKILVFIIFANFLSISSGLNCYKCSNEEGNYNDCIRSSIQCNPNQDTCFSDVIYTTPSYWTQSSERRAFVSKGCSTKSQCALMERIIKERCTYDMKQDWACIECCTTDNCNYVVKNNSRQLRSISFLKITFFGLILSSLLSFSL